MFLPPGTPKAIVDRLHEAIQAALSDPETLERLKARGVVPKGGTTEEFAAHFQSELLKYKRIVSEAKITAD
jgi:tripartite-type tricarboxylate transporter receptor subunit TctC